MADKSFIGKGKVYLDGRQIGNVSALSYSISEEKKSLPDYTAAGGGEYNSLRRIESVEISMTMHDYSPDNLAVALFGSKSAVAAAAVTDEAQSTPATLDGDVLVAADNVIDVLVAPVITGTGGTPTYTVDDDYTASPAGITVIDGGAITGGTALEFNYTKLATDVVQALVASATDRVLILDGLNEAQSGEAVVITVHRAKFGGAENLEVIGDEFGSIELTGDALKDTTIVGAGLSQYIEIKQAA